MTFAPIWHFRGPQPGECRSQSYYSGGVLAECELDAGHEGRHEGHDRWGFVFSWNRT